MEHSPYLPPSAEIMVPIEDDFALASRSQRLGGTLVNGLALASCTLPLIFTGGLKNDRGSVAVIISGIILVAVLGTNIYLLYTNGQSIGKRVMGTKIIRSNGERAGFWRIIIFRNIPMWILGLIPTLGQLVGLIDSLLIFRGNHKCLHDDIASTIVIVA